MKRNIVPLLLAAAAWLFTSCLGSSDSDVQYSNDTAITTFALGTLNRYVHTKAKDGVTDSTYRVAVTGSKYKFRIDHMSGQIYNPDSLPYGTDVTKAVATVLAKGSGVVLVKSTTDNSTEYFRSVDSLDYSQPRTFLVYAYDGDVEHFRAYIVTVNVHKEPADSFVWTKMPAGTVVPRKERAQGSSKCMYKIEDRKLWRSKDNGATWTEEPLNDTNALLPDDELNFTSMNVKAANNTEYVLLSGNSDAMPQYAVNWYKYEDANGDGMWTFINVDSRNPYALPKMEGLNVARFDDSKLIAIGGRRLYVEDTKEPYAEAYVSRDNGLTWIPNDGFALPKDLDKSATYVRLIVDGCYVWLDCLGTGEVWRGHLAQSGE